VVGHDLDECFRNIVANRPKLKPEALDRTRELITRAVPDCMVTGFEGLIDGLVLPDLNDRHVLAAAIRAGAQAVVTFNLDDFPAVRLEPYNIEATPTTSFSTPSTFRLELSPRFSRSRRRRSRTLPAPSESCSIHCASKASCDRSRSFASCSLSAISDHSQPHSAPLADKSR